jgi:hypothetical protein
MKAVVRYGTTVARAVASDWNTFWHTPADPTLLGLLRIATGLMLVYTHAVWGLALSAFFGPTSWLSPSLVRSIEAGQFMYSFWPWLPAAWMWPVYALTMVIFVLFTVGLYTRVTSVLALITAISYAHRVPAALFGLDQINIMLTLYLAIGPSGAAQAGPELTPPCPECDGQPGPASDPGSHVRDLSVCGPLQAARALVVERRGDVAGLR